MAKTMLKQWEEMSQRVLYEEVPLLVGASGRATGGLGGHSSPFLAKINFR